MDRWNIDFSAIRCLTFSHSFCAIKLLKTHLSAWKLFSRSKMWRRIRKTCFQYTFSVQICEFQKWIDQNRSILVMLRPRLDGFGFLVKFWPKKTFQCAPICQIPDAVRLNIRNFNTALWLSAGTKSQSSTNCLSNAENSTSVWNAMCCQSNEMQYSCSTFIYTSFFTVAPMAFLKKAALFSKCHNFLVFRRWVTLNRLFESKFCALQHESKLILCISISS